MFFILYLILSFLLVIALIILSLLIFRLYIQKTIIRKSKNITSDNGYSAVETFTLGGFEQHILIQACDINKPVMLVLHGGPGMPFPGAGCRGVENISQVTTSKLIENFVLIYWDQRGTGKSFNKSLTKDSMRIEQFISDANELVDKLREKFTVEKIYLTGISWGSVIGVNLINRFPEKFYTYFGLAQIINWAESDKLSYSWAIEYAKASNNKKALNELMKAGFPPYSDFSHWNPLRTWLMKFGGYAYKGDLTDIPKPMTAMKYLLLSPDYSLKNIINIFKGMSLAYNDEMIKDISKIDFLKINKLDIPVYFFQGKHDMVFQSSLMKMFFEQLQAPGGKELIWLDNSAHFFYSDDANKVEDTMLSCIEQYV